MGYFNKMKGRYCVTHLVIAMCLLAQAVQLGARPISVPRTTARNFRSNSRGLKFLVELPTILTYHNGTILSGTSLPVYLIWYGNFTDIQRSIVSDFFGSTQSSNCTTPSVAGWWGMTGGYKDLAGVGVGPEVVVQGELSDTSCSMGKNLLEADLESLVASSLTTFPIDVSSVYMILTAEDVMVEDFCNSQCGSHYSTSSAATQNKNLAYGWVGNPATQCPGKCSWPFAQPQYGPNSTALLPPNGDVGMDGMIINLATILAGAATNPFDTGYYQGDASEPNEAASACAGMFGPGSYPGYAGHLSTDGTSGVSFNTWGINDRKYLLPALWDPVSTNCTSPT